MITIIPSKIKTKVLIFDLNKSNTVSTDILVQSLNYVPFLYISKLNDTKTPPIDGTTIDPKDVIYVKLHNSKFVPEIELYCEDSKGILFNDLYPFDHDTLISIFIKSNSELTMPIRMDFRVTEYETIKANEEKNIFKYLIKGILNVDELHYSNYESNNGTSFDVIKKIALNLNLGFASNVEESNDKMKWINPQNTYLEYIRNITTYSFISEDSFLWTFIDFYYNVNYINVQIELTNPIKNEKGTMTDPQINKNDEEKVVNMYLTNHRSFNTTNQYISKFNLVNQSFKVNLEKSYMMRTTWYNKNKNVVFKKQVKQLETDGDNLVQLYDENSQLFTKNVNDEYFSGKMDTDNVHENYFMAKVLNKYNFDNLEKMKLIVTLNRINFSIKRFQSIKVEIYNPDDMFSRDAGTKKPIDNINTRLSGYWYVTGINYVYRRSGGQEQEITLMRRDLSLNYGVGNDEKSDFRAIKK